MTYTVSSGTLNPTQLNYHIYCNITYDNDTAFIQNTKQAYSYENRQ